MSSPSDLPASTASFAIAAAILAGVGGFFLGQASSLGLLGTKTSNIHRDMRSRTSRPENVTSSGDSDLSEGHANVTDDETELQDFGANNEECKLVLVVRTDLGMTKGTSWPSALCRQRARKANQTYARQNCSTMLARNASML